MTISVHVFGRFCLRYTGQNVVGLESRKAQELLSYLLLHRQQHHSREIMASLLWPESSTTQAKRNLRQLLWQTQSTLLRSGLSSHLSVVADAEWLQLDIDGQCRVDADLLQQAWHEVKDIPGEGLSPAQYHVVHQAVDLYRGDFLDGCYEPWCLFERERLQTLYLALQEKLMVYYEQLQRYEHGLQCGLQILKRDRARERTHRRMMRLYYLSGERTAALRQYERCAAALSEELDVSPDERTQALYEQIKNDQLNTPRPALALVAPCQTPRSIELNDAPAQHVLHVLSERLCQLQMLQSSLQRDIQHTLHMIDQTLTDGVYRLHATPALTCSGSRSDQTSAGLVIRPVRSISGQEHQPHVSQSAS